MKKNKIFLNKEISIDKEKLLESRMVILANSGGGKSYAIRKFAEGAVKETQTIIIDPEGEFASLREKFDFILAGKDADVPAEVRSASLLALKLLELGKSAIIDLYELHPQERQRFVKIFFEAMLNAPKELYHPVFIVLDEAHEYAPEGKPSEATWAVEAMASRGRKRGFCLIPASQRISKLSKNVSAECNNKLIGRASQDIDMKRAGDELGFNKEHLKDLRQLQPGEFFAFGPAISTEVEKITIGKVETAHAKVSYKGGAKIAPPSDVIKKVLAELKDLPQEAEKEAKTVAELKKENTELRRKLGQKPQNIVESDPKAIEKAVAIAIREVEDRKNQEIFDMQSEWQKQIENWFKILIGIGESMKEFQKAKWFLKKKLPLHKHTPLPEPPVKVFSTDFPLPKPVIRDSDTVVNSSIGKCARMIYTYLLEDPNAAYTKTQVAVATGYSRNSGGFNNAISELSAAGLIIRQPDGALQYNTDAGAEGRELVISGGVDKSLQKWLPKLGACARAIWDFMLTHQDIDEGVHTKERIAQATEYSVTSGGFNNSLSELSALGLIERLPGASIRINPEILNL